MLTGYHRVSPGITGYHRVSPDIIGYHRISSDISGYHRISPGITGYHSTRLFYAGPAALPKRGRGDVPRLAAPPAHDYRSQNSGNNLLSTLSTLSYNVLHCYTRLTVALPYTRILCTTPHTARWIINLDTRAALDNTCQGGK